MSVEELRVARNGGTVAYLNFCELKNYYESGMFCFFEGEDAKYYLPRIIEKTKHSVDLIFCFDCEGKEEVLRVKRLISDKSEYDHVKKAYFVDRDFSEEDISSNDLFVTPCYSVENFYTSRL